ncbi:hypothetical protein NWFMUON74_61080 [Nocardia wallacei]|uniref:Uncharacterized protein n=1 Tax=Nocardia wallacei TaxID=480035 RepID=A0A7G1KUV3_9NOCA|nr:hypothetical protein NWFMUON74_61080 [Nocardia wallacei]
MPIISASVFRFGNPCRVFAFIRRAIAPHTFIAVPLAPASMSHSGTWAKRTPRGRTLAASHR